jgi:rubrerythrin
MRDVFYDFQLDQLFSDCDDDNAVDNFDQCCKCGYIIYRGMKKCPMCGATIHINEYPTEEEV